jgi:hypothetical protein
VHSSGWLPWTLLAELIGGAALSIGFVSCACKLHSGQRTAGDKERATVMPSAAPKLRAGARHIPVTKVDISLWARTLLFVHARVEVASGIRSYILQADVSHSCCGSAVKSSSNLHLRAVQVSALLSTAGVAMAAAPSWFIDPLIDVSALNLDTFAGGQAIALMERQAAALQQLHLINCRCACKLSCTRERGAGKPAVTTRQFDCLAFAGTVLSLRRNSSKRIRVHSWLRPLHHSSIARCAGTSLAWWAPTWQARPCCCWRQGGMVIQATRRTDYVWQRWQERSWALV